MLRADHCVRRLIIASAIRVERRRAEYPAALLLAFKHATIDLMDAHERKGKWEIYLRESRVWILLTGQLVLLVPQVEDGAAVFYRRRVVVFAPQLHPHFIHDHYPEPTYGATSLARSDLVQATWGKVVTGAASAVGTGRVTAVGTVTRSASAG